MNYRTPALQVGRNDFTSNAELQGVLRGLVRDAPTVVRLLSLGTSQGGVPIEALLFSRNADVTPASVQRSGRPLVLLLGQQHGDEPASSEAMIVLAQEFTRGRLQSLLDRINVVVLPRANPDGAQAGQRASANGVDIDRDHLLLKTPEARALAQLVRDYQPLVVAEAREYAVSGVYAQKFGAVQRDDAQVQYASTANLPAFFSKAADEWFKQPLFASFKVHGLSAQWAHGTTNDPADKRLSMGGALADSGRNVQGLKNTVSLMIETRGGGLGRTHLKRRVHTQVVAMTSVLQNAAQRGGDLLKLRQYVDADVSAQACKGQVVVEAAPTPTEYTLQMLDPSTGADKTLTVNWDSTLVLRELKVRKRPCGYWLDADQADAVARLRLLGVRVEQAMAKGVVQGESYAGVQSEIRTTPVLLDVPEGSYYVPLTQPLASLVVAALEPDTSASYFSGGVITAVSKQARVTALPGIKLSVMP
ncbi:MAG: peptidase M14 [Rhizobacter sp.]|nr:peptidase M14 [Rhizobacter sp.]